MTSLPNTRRNFFAVAVAIAVATPTAAMAVAEYAPPKSSIAEVWRQAVALARHINSHEFDEEESERQYERLSALEDIVHSGPINSRADAIAKLEAAGLVFERGHRIDEADQRSFEEAIRWLEAN